MTLFHFLYISSTTSMMCQYHFLCQVLECCMLPVLIIYYPVPSGSHITLSNKCTVNIQSVKIVGLSTDGFNRSTVLLAVRQHALVLTLFHYEASPLRYHHLGSEAGNASSGGLYILHGCNYWCQILHILHLYMGKYNYKFFVVGKPYNILSQAYGRANHCTHHEYLEQLNPIFAATPKSHVNN